MPHCHNCRCPEIGQNANNELCKLSAKVGSSHYKRPPCVWVASDSTVTESANRAARFRQTNWGKFVGDGAEWPEQKFNFGEEVKARVLSSDTSMIDVQATIVGCFLQDSDTVSPRTSMYHIRAFDGKHYYVSVAETKKIEVPVPIAFGNLDDFSEFEPSPPKKKRNASQVSRAPKKQRNDTPGSGAKNKGAAKDKSTTKKKNKGAAKHKSNLAPHQPPLLSNVVHISDDDGAAPTASKDRSASSASSRNDRDSASPPATRKGRSESPSSRSRSSAASPAMSPPSFKDRSASPPPTRKDRSASPPATRKGRSASPPKAGKHTYWVHRTRIATLRLIGNHNPWSAADAGRTWQKIATQIHEDTKDVTEMHPRTKKLMNCQVMATNGQALMMWYIRQVGKMDEAYNEKKEKSTSGQTGMRRKAIEQMAAASNDTVEEIEKEWDVMRHLKGLKDEAEMAKKMAKARTDGLKSLKDDEMPKDILRLACESKQVCLQGIRLLHKKKKLWEQELEMAKRLGRAPVASEQHKQDMQLLADLQKQLKSYSDYEEDEDEVPATSSDGRGRGSERGLKGSFSMLTAAVQQVSAMLQQEDSVTLSASKTLTTSQLKSNLQQLDDDIAAGLILEAGERALVREWQLKKYAQGLGDGSNPTRTLQQR
jgi:hypothetical protein